MKLVTVVGARPQFIKAAPVSRALSGDHDEVLVHTGQHYDPQMSDVFFAELGMRPPGYQLHVGSASHGAQTGRMLEAIETVLHTETPDALLVYGDTNSTLAAALAAAKCGVPVIHVEAGLRSFNRAMPEEINRVLVDHMSTLLFCPSATAAQHLAREGITEGVVVAGDVMHDALLDMREQLRAVGDLPSGDLNYDVLSSDTVTGTRAKNEVLVTLHRPSNTDDPAQLARVLQALARIRRPVCWPMHPRTRAALTRHGLSVPSHVRAVEPLGYRALVLALSRAWAVVTDSGGLQKEAYWLGTPCLTLRSETEWVETVHLGWNRLVDVQHEDLAALVESVSRPAGARDAYGTAGAAARIVATIEERLHGAARGVA